MAIIAVLWVGHFATTVSAFLAAVGDTMHRFDTGASAPLGSVLLQGLAATLLFPLGTVAYQAHSNAAGHAGWAPVVLNSLLWAGALYWAGALLRSRLVSSAVSCNSLHGENE